MTRLDDLRALEAAAWPGPWTLHPVGSESIVAEVGLVRIHPPAGTKHPSEDTGALDDAMFIAAARNALPALLDVADAARAALDPTQCSCSAEMPHSDGDCPVVDLAALRAALARLEAGR